MKILFLTNNPKVSDTLYDWLIACGEEALYESEPINADYVRKKNIGFIISYNYIHLIKRDVLDLLPRCVINLHTSLLPYNRGSNPNIWSFIEGTPSGVTIHEVDEGLDTGDILLQQQTIFDPKFETLRSSYDKLQQLIQKLFMENWDRIKSHKITPRKQTGNGTIHKKKDAQLFASILNYDDKISEFLTKLKV